MSSIEPPNNSQLIPLYQIAADPLTSAMTKSSAKMVADQDQLNIMHRDANIDQFISSAANSMQAEARAAKLNSAKDIVDERVFKHFNDVYQSGLSISGMWSQMESWV